MDLPHPRSIQEVIVDGAIAQADVDAAFAAASGQVTGVEFTTPQPLDDAPDAPVEVRVHTSGGRQLDLPGIRLARVVGDEWTWLTGRTANFDVPQLHGTVPASDTLIAAARTLFGNEPVLLAPHADAAATSSVVAVAAGLPASPPRTAVTTGISRLLPGQDARRALIAFAAARGLGVEERGDRLGFADGTVVTLADGGTRATDIGPGPTLAQVRDDAWFVSVEHQLLLDGRYPGREIRWTPGASTATITTEGAPELQAAAQVLGVLTDGVFHWAWAWPDFGPLPAEAAAQRLRAYGLDAGIPAFTVPRQDWGRVRVDRLLDAAKPVIGMWTHALTPLAPGVDAALALDAPQLRLPPVTLPVAQAVLARTEHVTDPLRAAQSWARFRGVATRREEHVLAMSLPTGQELAIDSGGELRLR